MVRGPLPKQFRRRARIFDFIGRRPREMIRSHVSYAIAGCLNRVHRNIGQRVEHVRHIDQLGPVELYILSGREVAEPLVPLFSDHRELAHLPAVHRAVGNGHPKHVGVQLKVQAILQP